MDSHKNRPRERVEERKRVASLMPDWTAAEAASTRTTPAAQLRSIRGVLEAVHSPLGTWVVVLVDPGGDEAASVVRIMGEEGKSLLELKGLLHDALWAAIHVDEEGRVVALPDGDDVRA